MENIYLKSKLLSFSREIKIPGFLSIFSKKQLFSLKSGFPLKNC